jgi:predicted GNAT family acetyltransferase
VTGAQREAAAIEDEGDRFVLVDGADVAELTYLLDGDQLILLHTGVPANLEGAGVGGRLVRAAVDRAARERLTIQPWCEFARRWLHNHADVAAAVPIDWTPPERR